MLLVNGFPCTTPAGFAAALVGDWDGSRDLLWDGGWSELLTRWVDETGDTTIVGVGESLVARTPDHRVARLASFLDPFRQPEYRGRPLTPITLRDMAARSAHDPLPTPMRPWPAPPALPDPSDAEVLRAVEQDALLTAWSSSDNSGAFRRIDEVWRNELTAALSAPMALAGRDRPPATFARGVLLITALGQLTPECPVCGEEAASPTTTCRLVRAMAAVAGRPPTMGAGAALVLWSSARQRDELTRRAEQLDQDLALARADNEPGAVVTRIALERARVWVWWGVVAAIVLAAFGLGAGRRGALIAAICVLGLAGLVRWWLDAYHPQPPPPPRRDEPPGQRALVEFDAGRDPAPP
jgi:hypothetical protein